MTPSPHTHTHMPFRPTWRRLAVPCLPGCQPQPANALRVRLLIPPSLPAAALLGLGRLGAASTPLITATPTATATAGRGAVPLLPPLVVLGRQAAAALERHRRLLLLPLLLLPLLMLPLAASRGQLLCALLPLLLLPVGLLSLLLLLLLQLPILLLLLGLLPLPLLLPGLPSGSKAWACTLPRALRLAPPLQLPLLLGSKPRCSRRCR